MKLNTVGFSIPMSLALMLPLVSIASAGDLRVLVSGIENDQGEIRCLLFSGSKGFPEEVEDAVRTISYPTVAPMMTCTFADVEPGRYAVVAVHDENGNAQVDAGFTGSFKEPWGVTNITRPARGLPKYLDAMIKVNPDGAANFEVVVSR
jgi:uncharacterized protein (DUF2141 family)